MNTVSDAGQGTAAPAKTARRAGLLNGNALKIIAIVAMTVDHLGLIVFDNNVVMRIIGRIALPVFAYMIAEGCRYTRNKTKYFLLVFGLGMLCQIFYYILYRSFDLNILLTFSLSIAAIFALQSLQKATSERQASAAVLSALALAAVLALAFLIDNTDLLAFAQLPEMHLDYGFFGVLLPVLVSLHHNKYVKLFMTAAGLLFLCLAAPGMYNIQWFCFAALVPLALYDGTRGKLRLKYLFYIYYPAHLLVIGGIGMILYMIG